VPTFLIPLEVSRATPVFRALSAHPLKVPQNGGFAACDGPFVKLQFRKAPSEQVSGVRPPSGQRPHLWRVQANILRHPR